MPRSTMQTRTNVRESVCGCESPVCPRPHVERSCQVAAPTMRRPFVWGQRPDAGTDDMSVEGHIRR